MTRFEIWFRQAKSVQESHGWSAVMLGLDIAEEAMQELEHLRAEVERLRKICLSEAAR